VRDNGLTPTPRPLRLTQVPARRGLLWVRQGFQAFVRKPMIFTAMLTGALLFGMLLSVIPLIGLFAPLMLLPLLTLLFMTGTQSVVQGNVPKPQLLWAQLRADPKRRNLLLQLGLAYAVATIAIFAISGWADGGAMDALESAMGSNDLNDINAAFSDPQLQIGLALRMGLSALLSMPFWHAPALIWWGGQGFGQSLFSSTLACWRARGAFVVYGLVWAAIFVLMSALLALVVGLAGGRELLGVAAVPVMLIFSAVFYASLYFTFVDSFSAEPPADEA
jgi:hypothetical protein